MIQNAFWNCKDDPSSATHSWNTKWESDSSLKTKANVINKFYYYITMLPEIKHSNWLKLCDLKHPIRLLQIIVMQCNYLFVTSTTVCRWSESVKKYCQWLEWSSGPGPARVRNPAHGKPLNTHQWRYLPNGRCLGSLEQQKMPTMEPFSRSWSAQVVLNGYTTEGIEQSTGL